MTPPRPESMTNIQLNSIEISNIVKNVKIFFLNVFSFELIEKFLKFLIGERIYVQRSKFKKEYVLDTNVLITALADFLSWIHSGVEYANKMRYNEYWEVVSRIFESSISRGILVKYCIADENICLIPYEVESEVRRLANYYRRFRREFSTVLENMLIQLKTGIKLNGKTIMVIPHGYDESIKDRIIKILTKQGFKIGKVGVKEKYLSMTDIAVIALAETEREIYKMENITIITYDKLLADAAKTLGINVIFIPEKREELIREFLENVKLAERLKHRK